MKKAKRYYSALSAQQNGKEEELYAITVATPKIKPSVIFIPKRKRDTE
jgi:hypothetical protein